MQLRTGALVGQAAQVPSAPTVLVVGGIAGRRRLGRADPGVAGLDLVVTARTATQPVLGGWVTGQAVVVAGWAADAPTRAAGADAAVASGAGFVVWLWRVQEQLGCRCALWTYTDTARPRLAWPGCSRSWHGCWCGGRGTRHT